MLVRLVCGCTTASALPSLEVFFRFAAFGPGKKTVNPSLRKLIVPALTLVALAFLTSGSALAEEVTRVFLFAGQSNVVLRVVWARAVAVL
jgi:hypothetical protein